MSSPLCIRPGLLCLTLAFGASTAVAAAQPPPGCFALPVTGGEPVLERLGIRPDERGHALLLLAHALHGASGGGPSGSLAVTFTEIFGPVTAPVAGLPSPGPGGPPAAVLAPFSDRTWRRVLALDTRADLFAAIVKHRGALLVAAGALGAEPGLRVWLDEQPRLLQQIVLHWPGSFVRAAPALGFEGSRLVLPGPEASWTALVGVPPARPAEFLRRLLARDEGRLARFVAALAELPDDRREALLQPLPGEDAAGALAATYAQARTSEAPWSPNEHPFQMSYADLPSVMRSLADLPPTALPASAAYWPALVAAQGGSREDAAALIAGDRAAVPFAQIVRALLRGMPRERRDRMTVIALARRVWTDTLTPAEAVDACYALAHYRRFRALLLTLDRMGVYTASVWARLVDAARRLDAGGGSERLLRLGLAQGALALVERATLAGALSPAGAALVLRAFADAVDTDTAIATAIRGWLLESFVPALPPLLRPDRFTGATAYESRILQALAGPPADARPVLTWEGLDYVIDHTAAEHERITRIRAALPSPGLDAALATGDPARLSAALRALAYAPALGDPDGAVTLSPDVIDRHDFGGTRAAPGRDAAWTVPQDRTGSGTPWHVAGSLLGLDLALARTALRRLSADDMPAVPTINLNDELTLARTAVAARPALFDDATRDELAAAIARGRERVAAARSDPGALLRLADEVAVPRVVRNGLAWSLAEAGANAAVPLFSLRDLLWLGRPALPPGATEPWGVLSEPLDGRLRPRFDPPVPWDRLSGHPDTGVLATQVPDLALRLAEITAALRVPASLVPPLLLYATQDYWHDVEARFADDWPALVRAAAALPASRVEDYIAALGSGGPLRPR